MTDDYRERILDLQVEEQRASEKQIQAISGAGLTLTILFYRFVAGGPENVFQQSLFFLKMTWVCFIIAPLFVLISHELSKIALSDALKKHDETTSAEDEPTTSASKKPIDFALQALHFFNAAAPFICLAGVMSMLTFGYWNL